VNKKESEEDKPRPLLKWQKPEDEYLRKPAFTFRFAQTAVLFHDYHIVLALAMGADFVMMGRYFARFDESPTKKVKSGNGYVKEYWGEGSNRARNWQRYDHGGESTNLKFERRC